MEIFTDDSHFLQPGGSFPASADFTGHLQPPDDHFVTDHCLNLPPQKLRPIRSSGRSPAYTPEFADVVEFLGQQTCTVKSVFAECFEAEIKAEPAGVGGSDPGQPGYGAEAEDRVAGVENRASEDLTGSLSSGDNGVSSSVGMKETPSRKRKRKSRRKIELLLENFIFKLMEKQEQMHKQLMEMIERNERERIRREEAWMRQLMERLKKDEEARAQEASRSLAIISFIQKILGHEIEIPLPSSGSCMEENGGRGGNNDELQEDNNTSSNPVGVKHPEANEQTSIDRDDVNQIGNFNGGDNRNCIKVGISKICNPQDKRWQQVREQANICLSNVLQNRERKDVNHATCPGSDNHLQVIISQKNDSTTDKRWMGAQGQTNICDSAKSVSDGMINHLMENDTLKERNHNQKLFNRQSDPNSRRWPEPEVQALIMVRTELEHKFRSTGSKCPVWDEISTGMSKLGYSRSAKKCKEKWENMNKYFKKAMESGKKQFENSKRCSYFHDLDILYKNGFADVENSMNGLQNHQEIG